MGAVVPTSSTLLNSRKEMQSTITLPRSLSIYDRVRAMRFSYKASFLRPTGDHSPPLDYRIQERRL